MFTYSPYLSHDPTYCSYTRPHRLPLALPPAPHLRRSTPPAPSHSHTSAQARAARARQQPSRPSAGDIAANRTARTSHLVRDKRPFSCSHPSMAPKNKGKAKDAGDAKGKLKPATSINVRHILCEKHGKKEEALEKLRNGAKFDEVAREMSEDKARQGGCFFGREVLCVTD